MNAALEALLTLNGQNTFNFDALVKLLIAKGLITEKELSDELDKMYTESKQGKIGPAEWARRCLNPEDGEALDGFFGK
jgi:hypothetical protein